MRKTDLEEIVERLKQFDLVHSVLLFGSEVKGESKEESDIDICIIEEPRYEVKLKDKIKINAEFPEKIDISFFHDLLLNIRHRVLKEGKILYTKDKFYVYTLIKETSFELPKYRKFQEEYHKKVMERVEEKVK